MKNFFVNRIDETALCLALIWFLDNINVLPVYLKGLSSAVATLAHNSFLFLWEWIKTLEQASSGYACTVEHWHSSQSWSVQV